MTSLQEQKCEPCRGGVEPLKGDALREYADKVSGWEVVDEHHITKTFEFDDFAQALSFVNRVGDVAEQEQHHPVITFTYGKATIKLYTHEIDGLHANDFIVAAKVDELPQG